MTYTNRIYSLSTFSRLVQIVQSESYPLYGPKVHNAVLFYDILFSEQDLPSDLEDEQRPGYHKLKKRSEQASFGYNIGPHSWEKHLFPQKEQLFSTHKQARCYRATEAPQAPLYHQYSIEQKGIIQDTKIMAPSSQNQKSIAKDLFGFAKDTMSLPDPEIHWRCEQSVGNYDPLISCSSHFFNLGENQ
jgi:hypothetical protein